MNTINILYRCPASLRLRRGKEVKMKYRVIIFAFCFLFLTFRLLAADTWIKTYQPFYNPNGENDYYVEDVRICPDSGYAINGHYWYFDDWTEEQCGYLMKTDSDGYLLWAKKDTVSFYDYTEATAFVVLNDGSFMCAGRNAWLGGGYYLMKRYPDGNKEWEIQVPHSIEAMELTDDGNIITTGSSMEGPANLQKFDLDGNLIWGKTYLPAGFDFGSGYSVTQTADGGYALTGSVYGDNNKDVLVIKTDGDGDSLWSWTYDAFNLSDQGNSIIEDNNHNLFIAGRSIHQKRTIYTLIAKLDNLGESLWVNILPDFAECFSILEVNNKNSFVGYSWSGSSSEQTRLFKFDETGFILWNMQLPHWPAEGDRCFQELSDSGFICGGRAQLRNFIYITRTDSNGSYLDIDNPESLLPIFSLECYPNPFSSYINIQLSLNNLIFGNKDCSIKIYNLKGELVKELQITNYNLQLNEVLWDGKNVNGNVISNGIYFIIVKYNNLNYVKKITKIGGK